MLEVIVLHIKQELSPNDFARLLPLVSPEKRDRIKKIRFSRDARNTLLGDIMARKEICARTGLGNQSLVFSANAYGKPFLVNDPNIYFNISHAENYVVLAVDNAPIGVDIELIRPIDIKIAERFFAKDEKDYILSAETDMQAQRFFEVWTMKESHIKWDGKGLSKPLPSFCVFDRTKNPHYHKAFQNNNVICHVCTEKPAPPNLRFVEEMFSACLSALEG